MDSEQDCIIIHTSDYLASLAKSNSPAAGQCCSSLSWFRHNSLPRSSAGARREARGATTTISQAVRKPGTDQRAGCLLSKRRVGLSSATMENLTICCSKADQVSGLHTSNSAHRSLVRVTPF